MKKILTIMLAVGILLSTAACTKTEGTNLMENVTPQVVNDVPNMDAGAAAAADFGVRLFQTALEDDKNTLISPLSVLYALSMTANGADGETLEQMEEVLGMDIQSLNSFMAAYMKNLPTSEAYKLHLANGIWFRDDPSFEVNQDFLQTNANYYNAEIRKAAFHEATRKEINDWVKTNTDGMIPEILDQIHPAAVMYLVNALAFEAKWAQEYEEFQIRDGSFTTEDGTVRNVQMMHSAEHRYLEDEQATGFVKYYEDQRYAFVALLPKEGVTVAEYVEGLTGEHLKQMLAEPEDILVETAIPKFETRYDVQMSEILQQMGMNDAFSKNDADFSRLGIYHSDGSNIYISRVLHKTFISVAEQGTKAGAATVIELPAEGAFANPEYRTVTLDRPFVYLLIDCETNLPFFIGTMMDVG